MTTLYLQTKRRQSFPDWATGRRGRIQPAQAGHSLRSCC